jgi:hypothetical protein
MDKLKGLLIVVLFAAFSCCPKISTHTTSTVTDSTSSKITVRLDTVRLPGDTVTLINYIECDSVTNKPKPVKFNAKSGKAHVSVKVDATGQLTATGGCDSLEAVVKAYDKELFRYRHENKKEVVTRTEFKTRDVDIFCRWFTGIVLVLLTVAALLKFKGVI